jgi:hypothetical protein
VPGHDLASAGFACTWTVAAFHAGQHTATTAALLLAYPAWLMLAGLPDVPRNHARAGNWSLVRTMLTSLAMTLGVACCLRDLYRVLATLGIWTILWSMLQLARDVRRWSTHGAYPALADSVTHSQVNAEPTVAIIAGYPSH